MLYTDVEYIFNGRDLEWYWNTPFTFGGPFDEMGEAEIDYREYLDGGLQDTSIDYYADTKTGRDIALCARHAKSVSGLGLIFGHAGTLDTSCEGCELDIHNLVHTLIHR